MSYKDIGEKRDQLRPGLIAQYHWAEHRREDSMAITLTGGVLERPKRICIHGIAGIGKSTFAAAFPSPAFIDTEGSTAHMNVQRLDTPTSWNMLLQLLADIKAEKTLPFKTLVIDTVDWAEKMGMAIVAKEKGKSRFGDIGWGWGNKMLAELFKDVMDALEAIQTAHNITVCLVAHTTVNRIDKPDLIEGYHRYEMKLSKWVTMLVMEWCDIVLFANSKSKIVETDSGKNKGIGTGEERVVYTTDIDAHQAKNRFNLPPELPFTLEKMNTLVKYLLAAKQVAAGAETTTETETVQEG